jgi:hypothetical protein
MFMLWNIYVMEYLCGIIIDSRFYYVKKKIRVRHSLLAASRGMLNTQILGRKV